MLENQQPKNTLIRFAIAIIVIIIIAIYYFSELRPFQYAGYERSIDKLQRDDALLNESIVQSRFGTIKYYDPINNALNSFQSVLSLLRKELNKHPNSEINKELSILETAAKKKAELTENFKSINPVLINAINQFSSILSEIIESQANEQLVESALGAPQPQPQTQTQPQPQAQDISQQLDQALHFQVLNKIRDLFRDMLLYINLRSEEKHLELTNLVKDLKQAPKTAEMFPRLDLALAYADKILELQPKMNHIDSDFFNVPIVPALNSLNEAYKYVYQNYLSRSYAYRIVLYALVFALLILLRWAFSQLQGTVNTLHIEVQRKMKAEKALEETNRQLEQRVSQRTHELTVKNKDLNQALGNLKEAQDQLIMQEKMASVGMLTTGIAHEIKNPLNFVNNFSDISVELVSELKEEINANKEKLGSDSTGYIEDILNDLSTNCSKIKEHGQRADNIVKNMLMHSQETGVQKEMCDIKALMEDNIHIEMDVFTTAQGKLDIKIEKNYDPHLEKVLVAPQTIGRVFIYTLDNALYALKERALKKEPGYIPTLTVSITSKDSMVIIKIKDNGIGIPKSALLKVFEPFFTTKPTGKGNTGLGLSICYDTIVKQHKGEMRVASEEGVYTEFTIELPMNTRKNGN